MSLMQPKIRLIIFFNFDCQKTIPQEGFCMERGIEVRGFFLKKRKLCVQSLAKEQKQPAVVILQQSIFYNTSIRCLWLRIIRRSDQGVQFMNFPSKIFFNNINHGYSAAILKKSSLWVLPSDMVAATYCYYKKEYRTMHTAIVLFLLKKVN